MRSLAGIVLGLLVLFTSMGLPAQGSPPFRAVGDASLQPMMLLWIDDYRSRFPAFQLDMQFPGTTQGISGLVDGSADIAPCSRTITADERQAFVAKWGVEPAKLTVALDALVHIVHKSNPVKQFKIEELDAIWSTTRGQGWPKDITLWGELGAGGDWANRPITLYGRTTGSGLRDFFLDVVLLNGKAKTNVRRPGADGASMAEAILSDSSGLTYGSISEVYTGTRAVAIVPRGGKTAVEPNAVTIANATYPLVHPLYIYYRKSPQRPLDPSLLAFLRYLVSPDGQKLVQANDLISLPPDLITLNQRLLLH